MKQLIFRFPASQPEHAAILHPSNSNGIAVVCHKGDHWVQDFVSPSELIDFLNSYKPTGDVYISQNRFSATMDSRAINNLLECGAVWTDLDYYNQDELKNKPPEYIYELCLEICFEKKIPEPSLAIYSGRGLYLVWLHSPIQKRDIEHWNGIQRCIHALFKKMGSDRNAIDSARVLRLIGSENSKSGERVRFIGGDGAQWQFEDLFNEIYVPDLDKLWNKVEFRGVAEGKIVSLTDEIAKRNKTSLHYRGKIRTARTMWATRLQDLHTLIQFRWPEGVPEGWRNNVSFLLGVALSWVIQYPDQLERELKSACRTVQLKGYTEKDFQQTFYSLKKRIELLQDKKGFLWQGKPTDPRYRYKTQTIIDLFEISESEMISCNLRGLATPKIILKNKSNAKKNIRRASGIVARDEWLKSDKSNPDSLESQKPWESLNISRATFYRQKKSSMRLQSVPVYEGGIRGTGDLKPWDYLNISKSAYYRKKKKGLL